MPFPFQPKPETVKTNGVVSLLSSDHRQNVGNSIKLPVANFKGQWGGPRDKLIQSSKILVNIHYRSHDFKILETIRCYHALEMRTLVISEPCLNSDIVLLKDYIIFADSNDIPKKVQEVLDNYDIYYQKIFGAERVKELNNLLKQAYHKAVSLLMTI